MERLVNPIQMDPVLDKKKTYQRTQNIEGCLWIWDRHKPWAPSSKELYFDVVLLLNTTTVPKWKTPTFWSKDGMDLFQLPDLQSNMALFLTDLI